MALLKKINVDSEYSFDYVQKESYSCNPRLTYTDKQMSNGKWKRVYDGDFEQVDITITLALLTVDNINDILDNLVDGAYEYDYKGVKYRANFLVNKPPLQIRESSSKFRYKNMAIVLKKSNNYQLSNDPVKNWEEIDLLNLNWIYKDNSNKNWEELNNGEYV